MKADPLLNSLCSISSRCRCLERLGKPDWGLCLGPASLCDAGVAAAAALDYAGGDGGDDAGGGDAYGGVSSSLYQASYRASFLEKWTAASG